MQGLTYSVIGHVSSITERYTREQKKFLIVNFDLLGGPIEVIVWPDVLERTADLWGDGKLLRTTGKLRLRGDGYSLACEQVSAFVPPPSTNGETVAVKTGNATGVVKESGQPPADYGNNPASAPEPTRSAAPARRGGPGLDNRNGNSANNGPGNGATRQRSGGNGNGGNGPGNGGGAVSGIATRTVFLGIAESDDAVEDAHLLREVIRMLLEYPGKDRVNLEIHTGGRRVVMELPVVSTGYCEELRGRLEELLGANSVLLQSSDGPELEDVPF